MTFDLSGLTWTLTGYHPDSWRTSFGKPDVKPVSCHIPCSVQKALLDAGVIEDWLTGDRHRSIEWIEHRHWVFDTTVPGSCFSGKRHTWLCCEGLDYAGEIFVNGSCVLRFANSLQNYRIDISDCVSRGEDCSLRIVFTANPYWLGCFGSTGQMTCGKPRYYYTWDWTCRLVQTGIWDSITITETNGPMIDWVDMETDYSDGGSLQLTGHLTGSTGGTASLELSDGAAILKSDTVLIDGDRFTASWSGLPVEPWQPNGAGRAALYTLTASVISSEGDELGEITRQVGFRRVEWLPTAGAPEGADGWLCSVNGEPQFLQGVNWVPPVHNFADVTEDMYRELIDLYKSLGVNIFRVWGGAILEREIFYDLCDRAGIMVWQEFPQSSSAIDNYPSEDPAVIDMMVRTAETYIKRRKHHPSLILWCGGNELFSVRDGIATPCGMEHPMLKALGDTVAALDPGRRYIPASPTGPRMYCDPADAGKGLHHNTHGPWLAGDREEWTELFTREDSMFRAETGAPGASPMDILEEYKGDLSPYPITDDNPFWFRPMGWWSETGTFRKETGRQPKSCEEYVLWSQARQAELLTRAVGLCKNKFPACGGFILWMGHDNYPCPCNTSIVDFHRRPKPAALMLAEKVWKKKPGEAEV
ncbi:MAG: hypothetical protein IK083_10055 [Abditibacteriota bacterium]|nr:hypothetical protein [Abditibacteriota bacterium]